MSAASRLWRRAPLWRLCLASAASFALLSALYPSAQLTRWLRRAAITNPFVSPPHAPPGVGVFPPLTRGFTAVAPFAGRKLPLPDGSWREIVAARFEGPTEENTIVLARTAHDALTGLILAVGSTMPPPVATMSPNLPEGCFDARNPVTVGPEIAPGSPRDCWFATAEAVPAGTPEAGHKPAIGVAAYARLRMLGIALPARMVETDWTMIGGREFLHVIIAVPATTHASPRARAAWMRRWVGLLRRGFDGGLAPRDVSPGLAHDPT